jgi:hypothetical protein
MGWLFQSHSSGTTNRQAWENDYKSCEKVELVAHAFRAFNSRCWSVWKVKETGHHFIMVTLIERKMEQGYPNIGFKDIETSCGPYYYDCPAKFVKMLGNEDQGAYHKSWLEGWHAVKERAKAKKKTLAIA